MAAGRSSAVGAALWLGIGACSGGNAGPDPNGPAMAKASASGDFQSGPAGTVLPQELRVVLTQSGTPVAGRTVTWAVLASGGAATPASSVSGADGVAATSVTLPPFAATTEVAAASQGIVGSPLAFRVTSTGATTTAIVWVGDNEFLPDNLQLKAGGSVTFLWLTGAGPHNVTPVPPNVIPTSSNPAPPGTHLAPYSFVATFPVPGSFAFFCGVHGDPTSGMRGAVTVVP